MKKILLTLLLACCFLGAKAQPAVMPGSIYASINGGGFAYKTAGGMTMGVPSFGVELGSWLMKPLAFQLAYEGAMAPSTYQKGTSNTSLFSFVSAEFKWDFNATFFHVYNKTFQYPVPVYPMIGLGLLMRPQVTVNGVSYHQDNEFQAMLGMQLPVRLSDHWSASLEYKCFFIPQGFDGSNGPNNMHMATLGFIWRQGDDPYRRKTAFEARTTSEDWFVGYGVGALFNSFEFEGLTIGNAKTKLWNITGDMMFGRNWSDVWTIRFELSGYFARHRYNVKTEEPGWWYPFNMLHADFMVNVPHLFSFSRGARLSVLPYLGAGPVWTYKKPVFTVGADAGVMFRYYIDNAGDLFFDAKYMMVPPRVAGGSGPSGSIFGVGYMAFTVGYIHNFGHSTVRYRMPVNHCTD